MNNTSSEIMQLVVRGTVCPLRRVVILSALLSLAAVSSWAGEFKLEARHRERVDASRPEYHTMLKPIRWDASKTAVVICDMWDQHWCQGATRRVAEMAPRMNQVVKAARRQGALIVHCPSSCLEAYRGTAPLRLAEQAPAVETSIPLQGWCHLDPSRETRLPIDDSDGGCDCEPRCASGSPWRRQIDVIEIHDGDAISDNAQAYYLMKQRGIENVIVMGVHTNMCVLGRPFSIRQMVYQGMNVVLVRDMTDTMYNSRMYPFVNHHSGTDLVVKHIEEHWCPTITSDQLIGGDEFRFSDDTRPHLAVVIGEKEYHTRDTLPDFCERMLRGDFRLSFIFAREDDPNRFSGLELLDDADVALISVRRRALPAEQLHHLREFVAAGKPIVAIRTSSHAFSLRDGQPPRGHEVWPEFDRDVLGGNYQGHHGTKSHDDPRTFVRTVEKASDHWLLHGVRTDEFRVASWLYKTSPLGPNTTVLMTGRVEGREPHEPVAWTNIADAGNRVFYTSLGHPADFKLPAFQRLLANAVYWACDRKPSPPIR